MTTWPDRPNGPMILPEPARLEAIRAGDGRAMTALRVVTYVLASLASLAALCVVIYAGIKWWQISDALESLGEVGSDYPTFSETDAPDTGEFLTYCDAYPEDPTC